MKKLLIPISVLLLAACNENSKIEEKKEPTAQEKLVGTWSNTYLKLQINVNGPQDSIQVNEVTEENWEKQLGIKPIVTTFKEDGSYGSKYYNLNDSLVRETTGKWAFAEGDTLVMTELTPEKSEFKLHLSFGKYKDSKTDLAKFKGMIDFDMDGNADDLYYGEQRRNN